MVEREPRKAMAALSQQMCVSVLKAMAEPTRLRVLVLLAYGRTQRQGPDGHPGPEPAAHQPPPQAAGRGRAGRARARGQLGVLPPGRGRRGRRRWRAWCWRPSTAPIPCCVRDRRARGGLARGARGGGAGLLPDPCRRMGQHPRPARGRGRAWKRRSPTALGAGPFDLLVDLGTGTGRMLELFARRAIAAASAST